ncbi:MULTISPECIES: hypothetical protein [Pseudomonas]|nr:MULTISPECIES: hypothetical protein [Pseudomonas]
MKYSAGQISEQEVEEMLAEARAIFFPPDFPSASGADWLLEGSFSSALWKTKNGDKEFYDGHWHHTCNIDFNRMLPDYSTLMDVDNAKCLDALQKWAFALRCGWVGSAVAPARWAYACSWGFNFTSWLYLRKESFKPTEVGFGLVEKDDVKLLMEELSQGGWVRALKIIQRSYIAMYKLAFGVDPDPSEVDMLPDVKASVLHRIVESLENDGCYIKRDKTDQRIISRTYLCEQIGCTMRVLDGREVRSFLRFFEHQENMSKVLIPGAQRTKHPNAKNLLLDMDIVRPTRAAMNQHVNNCQQFFAGGSMPGIEMPSLTFRRGELIKELEPELAPGVHQKLVPLSQALASLNEAALWISEYGDALVDVIANHLVDRAIVDIDFVDLAYGARFKLKQEAFTAQICKLGMKEQHVPVGFGLVKSLGLIAPHLSGERQPKKGSLSLTQALYILIGACAYAIAVMKPMRDGELGMIEYDCVLRDDKSGGCFLKVPVEKSGDLGLLDEALRPIPYLTYKAITILQKLGDFTARFFYGDDARPTRLFYFPSLEGFSPPVNGAPRKRINRCMDWLCEYINFPLDAHGRRHYFRIHELRKFHLLMLNWDDRLHGWECGAWMAAHKDASHMQAYTDANVDGRELSEWEAEYVEEKILDLELNGSIEQSGDLAKLYGKVKAHFNVNKVSSLPGAKFKSYLKMMLASGDFEVVPIEVPGADGMMIDLLLIAKEIVNE